jgi:curved DNA-binding protein CbpA
MYFPIRRIESFMTSTATTGAQSNQVQARRDGKERNDLREEQDQARAGSTLVILTSVTFALRVVVLVVLTSSKRCLAGRAEAEVADLVAAVTLKLNSSCQSRKRTVAHGAQQMQLGEGCPTCGGSGLKDGKPCETCGGAGQVLKPRTIEVNIPTGVRDGSTIRLAGQGGTGSNGSEPGDLYLHIRLRPHPVFSVKGDDLEVELPITPWEAVLGAKVAAPTIDGKVELTIPPGAKSGQRLRLRGQGLNKRKGGRGDEYVRLKIVIPKQVSAEERRLYEELKRISRFDPRS